MNYRSSVDWLSFTMLVSPDIRGHWSERRYDVVMSITRNFREYLSCVGPGKGGRRPYTHSEILASRETGEKVGRVFYSQKIDHYLVELSGSGCQVLDALNVMQGLLRNVLTTSYSITRVDIAVDFETDLNPALFAATASERWRTRKTEQSDTGHTEYIGSRVSDRYAKVYRYYAPHPRADLLRVEVTTKKKAGAREIVKRIVRGETMEEVAAAVNSPFDWKHPVWTFEGNRITNTRPDNGKAATLHWLRTAVIPSLKRLWKEGEVPEDDDIWYEILTALPPGTMGKP